MLNGIAPLISPELLKALCEMGHGDEIVLADANFPSSTIAQSIAYREVILPLMPYQYDEANCVLMVVVPDDPVITPIWESYQQALDDNQTNTQYCLEERFAYYAHVKRTYAIVATGEIAQYKGVVNV